MFEGKYIIRDKDETHGVYALSCIHIGVPTHHVIDLFASPSPTFNDRPCPGCDSLDDVIEYLHRPRPLWPIVLTYPVPADSDVK